MFYFLRPKDINYYLLGWTVALKIILVKTMELNYITYHVSSSYKTFFINASQTNNYIFVDTSFYINEEGRHVCLRCSSHYKNKGDLLRHFKYECGVEPKFQCQKCQKKFKHKTHLKNHLARLKQCNENCWKPFHFELRTFLCWII